MKSPRILIVGGVAGGASAALRIPPGALRSRLDEIDKSRPVYTVCQLGKLSYFAARILQQRGYDVRCILGGAYYQLG